MIFPNGATPMTGCQTGSGSPLESAAQWLLERQGDPTRLLDVLARHYRCHQLTHARVGAGVRDHGARVFHCARQAFVEQSLEARRFELEVSRATGNHDEQAGLLQPLRGHRATRPRSVREAAREQMRRRLVRAHQESLRTEQLVALALFGTVQGQASLQSGALVLAEMQGGDGQSGWRP